MNQEISFINPADLLPHEDISILRALYIATQILMRGAFTKPILVDRKSRVVIDGHHRRWVAQKLGLKKIPCCLIDYLEDTSILIYSRRKKITVGKEFVIKNAINGRLYLRKTTRHVYKLPPFRPVPLKLMK